MAIQRPFFPASPWASACCPTSCPCFASSDHASCPGPCLLSHHLQQLTKPHACCPQPAAGTSSTASYPTMALFTPPPSPCLPPHQISQTLLSTLIASQNPANSLTRCPGPCYFPHQLPDPLLRTAEDLAFAPAKPLPATGRYSCSYLFFCSISPILPCSLLSCLPHQACHYPSSLLVQPIPHHPVLVPLHPPPPPQDVPVPLALSWLSAVLLNCLTTALFLKGRVVSKALKICWGNKPCILSLCYRKQRKYIYPQYKHNCLEHKTHVSSVEK